MREPVPDSDFSALRCFLQDHHQEVRPHDWWLGVKNGHGHFIGMAHASSNTANLANYARGYDADDPYIRPLGIEWFTEYIGTIIFLDEIAVVPKHQGEGIGGELFQAVEQRARDVGAKVLQTAATSDEARRFLVNSEMRDAGPQRPIPAEYNCGIPLVMHPQYYRDPRTGELTTYLWKELGSR